MGLNQAVMFVSYMYFKLALGVLQLLSLVSSNVLTQTLILATFPTD